MCHQRHTYRAGYKEDSASTPVRWRYASPFEAFGVWWRARSDNDICDCTNGHGLLTAFFPRGPVSPVMGFPESPSLLFWAAVWPLMERIGSLVKVYEYRAGVWCSLCSITTQCGWLEEELTACRCKLFRSANALFLLEPVQLMKILDSCSDDCGPVWVEPPALQSNFYLVNHSVLAGL